MERRWGLSTPTRSTRKHRQHPLYQPRPSQRLPALGLGKKPLGGGVNYQ